VMQLDMELNIDEVVKSINEDGIWVSPKPYPHIDVLLDYLKKKSCYSGHVKPQGSGIPRTFCESLENTSDINSGFICYGFEDVIHAPLLFDFMMDFNDVAIDFFKPSVPNFYSINAMWKKSSGSPGWHYDVDGDRLLVFFMYGSDILNKEDGPHCFIKGSHRWGNELRESLHNSEPGTEPNDEHKDKVLEIYGEKGTFFLSNPCGLHNGLAPFDGRPPRLLIWGRWSDFNPPRTYESDKLYPIQSSSIPMSGWTRGNKSIRECTKLLVDWEG
jgi:hypothetical protein